RRRRRIVISRHRRGAIARDLLLRLHLVVGLEYRAAAAGELWRVLPQAGRDAAHIRDLVAAQPPHIRRTGHLLFHGSAIFFGGRSTLCDDAADRERYTQHNPLCPHVPILLESLELKSLEFSSINETQGGPGPTKKSEKRGWNLLH